MRATNGKPTPHLTLYPKSDFLVRLRETKGLSQKEVETAAGLPSHRLYHYEKGRPIPLLHIELLAKAYTIPVQDLIDEASLGSAFSLYRRLASAFGWAAQETMNGAK